MIQIRNHHNYIFSSYLWPRLCQDVNEHVKVCLWCQMCKSSTNKLTPLEHLPIPERLNLWIHADIFGRKALKQYVRCITDAFKKIHLVTALPNKEAETEAAATFNDWFCKFKIPVQTRIDIGKGYVNKISEELFNLMHVSHT
jgi:hypothetical protein